MDLIPSWLWLAWLLAVGGAVGSFLNVVVYRVPRGMSLVHPGSRCPACGHAIRWYDNLPVVGWIALGGRCRDCQAPISPRYPLVEAAVAIVFVVLGGMTVVGGGTNLPLRPVPVPDGFVYPVPTPGQLAAVAAFHLLLLTTLLAVGLVHTDGHSCPWRVMAPMLAVGLVAPVVWPPLRPVAAWPALAGPAGAILDAAAGAGAGLLAGWVLGGLGSPDLRRGPMGALALVGLALGYQAAVALGLATGAVLLAQSLMSRSGVLRRPLPASLWLALLAAVALLFWRPLAALWPW